MSSSGESWGRQVINNIAKDALYKELWQACAGKFYHIPKRGDQVVYLPQPHIEEVRSYAEPDDPVDVPHHLPHAVLCSVAHVELMAEPETDEVIAGLTLVPLEELTSPDSTRDESRNVSPTSSRIRVYTKTLTASDVSTHGGYTIPKPQAEGLLPPLFLDDATDDGPATQNVSLYDLHGKKWTFRHKLRGNPKRHLFSSGWSRFLEEKKLIKGDTMVYARGENGDLRIGVRRSTKSPSRASAMASIVSGQTLQFGVLASVAHAVHTQSIFSVYCRPWRNYPPFIIPLDRYMNSINKDYYNGARFRMNFDNDECVERRFTGTIDGTEDIDPERWPGSKWKCLKVTWDVSDNLNCPKPDRVSPWEIELISSDKRKEPVLVDDATERKKPFQLNLGFQEGSSSASASASAYSDPGWLSNSVQTSQALSFPGYQSSSSSQGLFRHASSSNSSPGFGLLYTPKMADIDEPRFLNPRRFKSFTLFGKNIVTTSWEEELPSLANANHQTPPNPSGDIQSSSKQQAQQDKDDKGCLVQVINHTTPSMISRYIDLSGMSGYDNLIAEIDALFDFSGTLINGSSDWYLTYVDADGLDVPVGDCVWNEFVSAVKRIDIRLKDQRTHSGGVA